MHTYTILLANDNPFQVNGWSIEIQNDALIVYDAQKNVIAYFVPGAWSGYLVVDPV